MYSVLAEDGSESSLWVKAAPVIAVIVQLLTGVKSLSLTSYTHVSIVQLSFICMNNLCGFAEARQRVPRLLCLVNPSANLLQLLMCRFARLSRHPSLFSYVKLLISFFVKLPKRKIVKHIRVFKQADYALILTFSPPTLQEDWHKLLTHKLQPIKEELQFTHTVTRVNRHFNMYSLQNKHIQIFLWNTRMILVTELAGFLFRKLIFVTGLIKMKKFRPRQTRNRNWTGSQDVCIWMPTVVTLNKHYWLQHISVIVVAPCTRNHSTKMQMILSFLNCSHQL